MVLERRGGERSGTTYMRLNPRALCLSEGRILMIHRLECNRLPPVRLVQGTTGD